MMNLDDAGVGIMLVMFEVYDMKKLIKLSKHISCGKLNHSELGCFLMTFEFIPCHLPLVLQSVSQRLRRRRREQEESISCFSCCFAEKS